MAKRYKEKEKKKLNIKNVLIFLVVILIIVFIIIGIKQKWFDFDYVKNMLEQSRQEEISFELFQNITKKVEENRKLSSNILNPAELNNEINAIINEEEEAENKNYIVKIQYKLKTLNSGTIDIFYKVSENDLIKMIINLETKEIESTEQYEDEFLLSKNKIEENLEENIEKDFESRKEEIIENVTFLNVIITNTEVVTNIGYI